MKQGGLFYWSIMKGCGLAIMPTVIQFCKGLMLMENAPHSYVLETKSKGLFIIYD